MTAIVEKLYQYAVEKNFHPYLDIAEHNYHTQAEEKAEADIRQLLPPDQHRLLEDLQQSRNNISSVELEAVFQSGLTIGMELSRL